jgi:hypothetical protein
MMHNMQPAINPFYQAMIEQAPPLPAAPKRDRAAEYAKLPLAPITGSPVPRLTSLYHHADPGKYGNRSYPGNCGGNLIKDLIRFFNAQSVFDPLTGSGTCRDVCRELPVYCWSSDLHDGSDACDASKFRRQCFEFCFIHPPYWRMKIYNDDPRCLSQAPTLEAFLDRYRLLIENCAGALVPGGKLAILIGDYQDYDAGFVPLVYWTKKIAFDLGLRQICTDIIRFSHGASSSRKVYRSSFIPGLHDVCSVFQVPTTKEGA